MSRGTVCGFELKPEMLHSSVSEIQTAGELHELQNLYSGRLDIFFRKGGGFLIAISSLVRPDEMNDVVSELSEALITSPKLLNLSILT